MMLTARIKSCAAAVCVLAGCLLLPNAQAKAESISLPERAETVQTQSAPAAKSAQAETAIVTPLALAALPEQVDAVLNHRYRETGKARVFTITESALRELLGSTAPYTPPDLPFYTSEGSVLDVPPLKAP